MFALFKEAFHFIRIRDLAKRCFLVKDEGKTCNFIGSKDVVEEQIAYFYNLEKGRCEMFYFSSYLVFRLLFTKFY